MADNVNDKGDSRTIRQIVRAVVANLSALPNSAGLPPRATLSGSSASTVGDVLNNSFQIPRGQTTQRGSFLNNLNAKKKLQRTSEQGKIYYFSQREISSCESGSNLQRCLPIALPQVDGSPSEKGKGQTCLQWYVRMIVFGCFADYIL